jgi:hypothetical protein
LSFALRGMSGSEPILPTWGIVTETEGTFIVAQWKVLATTFSITERTASKKLCDALRKLAANDGSSVVSQIMALERELASLDAEIARQEREMNALVYALYSLSAEEIEMVEKG